MKIVQSKVYTNLKGEKTELQFQKIARNTTTYILYYEQSIQCTVYIGQSMWKIETRYF